MNTKLALNTENKPPVNPHIMMIGEQTVENLLQDDAINIDNRNECKKSLSDYIIYIIILMKQQAH